MDDTDDERGGGPRPQVEEGLSRVSIRQRDTAPLGRVHRRLEIEAAVLAASSRAP
jgi:hypothetical protein